MCIYKDSILVCIALPTENETSSPTRNSGHVGLDSKVAQVEPRNVFVYISRWTFGPLKAEKGRGLIERLSAGDGLVALLWGQGDIRLCLILAPERIDTVRRQTGEGR